MRSRFEPDRRMAARMEITMSLLGLVYGFVAVLIMLLTQGRRPPDGSAERVRLRDTEGLRTAQDRGPAHRPGAERVPLDPALGPARPLPTGSTHPSPERRLEAFAAIAAELGGAGGATP